MAFFQASPTPPHLPTPPQTHILSRIRPADSIDDNSTDRGEGGEGGTVIALVVAGALVVGLVGWMAVVSARRRQRRRWLGTDNEAEALPEDIFIRPAETYSGFH